MSTVESLVHEPNAADCFEVRDGGRRFGCRADVTADPRRLLGAWLDYVAGYSVLDLSLAECDEACGGLRFEANRPGRVAGLGLGRRVRPGSGTWWVPGETIDQLVERIAAREASRARQLAAA